MKTSETINEIASALIKFQGEVPVIVFDSTVKVTTKTGGSYSFAYASLKAIKETCKPILLKYELAVSQLIGAKQLTTILMHSSGQYISDAMDLPIKENMTPQEIGSVITYMKRYSYSAILGLVSDEDDDANIAENNKVEKKPTEKKPTPPPVKKPILTDESFKKVVLAMKDPKPTIIGGLMFENNEQIIKFVSDNYEVSQDQILNLNLEK